MKSKIKIDIRISQISDLKEHTVIQFLDNIYRGKQCTCISRIIKQLKSVTFVTNIKNCGIHNGTGGIFYSVKRSRLVRIIS